MGYWSLVLLSGFLVSNKMMKFVYRRSTSTCQVGFKRTKRERVRLGSGIFNRANRVRLSGNL